MENPILTLRGEGYGGVRCSEIGRGQALEFEPSVHYSNWPNTTVRKPDELVEWIKPKVAKAPKILLVDDSRADTRLIEEALKETELPHSLLAFASGEEALSYLSHSKEGCLPDMILLDLHLPTISGHQVLRSIKQDKRLRAIPVVILSGSSKPEDVRESYAAQASCFVEKPMYLDELVKVLTHIAEAWLGVKIGLKY